MAHFTPSTQAPQTDSATTNQVIIYMIVGNDILYILKLVPIRKVLLLKCTHHKGIAPENSNFLYLTKGLEQLANVLFLSTVWEITNIQFG